MFLTPKTHTMEGETIPSSCHLASKHVCANTQWTDGRMDGWMFLDVIFFLSNMLDFWSAHVCGHVCECVYTPTPIHIHVHTCTDTQKQTDRHMYRMQ